ncbi:hydrogenase [Palaeococcus pacificus DY20341]|uniref:Hydrogenase n=1 Tax=Palaeococcus pacificus DY20341 TaxID=1343739 RepID=A0A075LQU8_9EURY|nr:hypothetical protein [Palaeococcus pacificus]AIF68669.1 hydrogenase [Palaeococcus pacificus DY20341]
MFGYWDALYFLYVLAIGMIIAYMLFKWAERSSMGTRRTGDGTKIFISGEDEDNVIPQFEHFQGYYTGRHTMWGLIRGIHRMFLIFRREHTGLLTDYVAYLLITTAVVLGALVIWG